VSKRKPRKPRDPFDYAIGMMTDAPEHYKFVAMSESMIAAIYAVDVAARKAHIGRFYKWCEVAGFLTRGKR